MWEFGLEAFFGHARAERGVDCIEWKIELMTYMYDACMCMCALFVVEMEYMGLDRITFKRDSYS